MNKRILSVALAAALLCSTQAPVLTSLAAEVPQSSGAVVEYVESGVVSGDYTYSISTDKEPPREIEKINWKRYLDFCGQPCLPYFWQSYVSFCLRWRQRQRPYWHIAKRTTTKCVRHHS